MEDEELIGKGRLITHRDMYANVWIHMLNTVCKLNTPYYVNVNWIELQAKHVNRKNNGARSRRLSSIYFQF